jgi:polygalacturonase
VPEILALITPPQFPDDDFYVTDFGAMGDGTTDDKPAFDAAILACAGSGGGRVVVPAGTYLVKGPIVLDSNVNLHVTADAELWFSRDWHDFLPTITVRWEGVFRDNVLHPLIYAKDKTNIAITGSGVIDACARTETTDYFYPESAIGGNHRPALIYLESCNNILIEGVTLRESAWRFIQPVFCENVTVRGVGIFALSSSHNTDGINPDSSRYVLIENCTVFTGDDGIAIKSGKGSEAWSIGLPSQDIVIRNCDIKRFAIGSEMSGGVRNIFVENLTIDAERCDSVGTRYTPKTAVILKSNSTRGGYISEVYLRGISVVGAVAQHAVDITMRYGTGVGDYPPLFEAITIEDLVCQGTGEEALRIVGLSESPVQGVTLRDITVNNAARPMLVEDTEGLVLDNVWINGEIQHSPSNENLTVTSTPPAQAWGPPCTPT